jgi:hypothetical protein
MNAERHRGDEAGPGMMDWLIELNGEIDRTLSFLAEVAKHSPELRAESERAARRIEMLGQFINANTMTDSQTRWWAGEGSSFAKGELKHLDDLRGLDLTDASGLREWTARLDQRLFEGARADIDHGAPPTTEDRGEVRDFVRQEARKLADQLALVRTVEGVQRIRQQVAVDVESASEAAQEAQQYAENSRAASGEVGSNTMAAHFEEHSAREETAANMWRRFTVVIFTAVAAYSVYHLANPLGIGLTEAVARAGVALPFLALGAYCARESAQHRRFARWAGTLAVQLRTIDAFCDPLPESDRSVLRATFGIRVFDSSPLLAGGDRDVSPASSQGADSVGELTSSVRQLLEILRKTGAAG